MIDVQRLEEIEVFRDLTTDELEAMSQICEVKTYEAGSIIFKEGDEGKEIYVVDEGIVNCIIQATSDQPIVVGTRTRNSLFGWAAIVSPYRYTSTAKTSEKVRAFAIKGDKLRKLCDTYSHICDVVMQYIVTIERLRETELFNSLTIDEVALVSLACETRVYREGDTIFRENDESTEIFMVDEGRVQAIIEPIPNRPMVIGTITKNQLFGWSAMISPHRYTATVKAAEKTRVFVARGNDLRGICSVNPRICSKVMERIACIVSDRLVQTRQALVQAFYESQAASDCNQA